MYLFVLPLALAAAPNILGDKNPLYYFLLFVCGYVLVADPRFQEAIDRLLPLSIMLALLATVVPLVLWRGLLPAWSGAWVAANLLYQCSRWTWVLVILGAGHRWLSRESPLLRYCAEAAYPFCILHLPVGTLVTFYAIRLPASIGVKYALIVALTTLLSLALSELAIKRVGVLRFCFGMKAARRVMREA